MAMRRPRIKATALLTSKRKSRDAKTEKNITKLPESAIDVQQEVKNASESKEVTEETPPVQLTDDNEDVFVDSQPLAAEANTAAALEEQKPVVIAPESHTEPPPSENEASQEHAEPINDSFKCPARVEYSRSYSQAQHHQSDDSFHPDLEDNILQSDLQRGLSGFPMSPSKAQVRQRIRPVPVFQRRNSFIGSGSVSQTTDDIVTTPTDAPAITHRRERHHSASISTQAVSTSASAAGGHHHHNSHKFTPTMGFGRIRTESSCSAFSDSYAVPSKLRKTDEHNHRNFSRRNYEARFSQGAPDKSTLKMFDLIYYNPVTNPMEQKPAVSTIKAETKPELEPKIESKPDLESANSMPVPQLKLNSNGELILDDTSLVIETTAEQEARKVLANSSLIVLDENTGMNGFYKRQKRTKDWAPDETIKFYRCLQTVGTDFSLMCQLFPKRTRRDLKLKFKKEERHNLALINKALLYPKTFNIDELKQQLEREEKAREEAEHRWKEIKAKAVAAIKKVNVKTSIAARTLKHGDEIYQNENALKRKLSKRASSSANSKKKPPQTANAGECTQKPAIKSIEIAHEIPLITDCIKLEPIPHQHNHQTSVVSIKIEAVKAEQITRPQGVTFESERVQLEYELNDLLDDAPPAKDQMEFISNTEECDNNRPKKRAPGESTNKTLVDLDDGSFNVVSDSENDNVSVTTTEIATEQRELDEGDIQRILTDLAEGKLVLVSTLDPDNADKVVNEIYMLDDATGELCGSPLDIPEAIVQGILAVMS